MGRRRDLGTYEGRILQVQSMKYTQKFASSSTSSLVDVSNFNKVFTPKSADSTMIIYVGISIGGENDAYPYFDLRRTQGGVNTDGIGAGTVASGNQANCLMSGDFTALSSMQYRKHLFSRMVTDTPGSAAEITYQVRCANPYTAGSTGVVRVNHASNDGNNLFVQYAAGDLVIYEVAT
jgi:hypothetical protein|tara:strand:+ start:49 stop:582 length:534 start_codon:yes stop_codon:yes gene_type:complete